MKKNVILAFVITCLAFASQKIYAQYIDLSTGKTVVLVKHAQTGRMFNTETSKPVYLYVDASTNDTFYGRTGEKVNGKVMRNKMGHYIYDGDTYVYENGDYRLRTEADNYDRKVFKGDGDVVYKAEDKKMKKEIEGDVKRKNGEAKSKMEADGVQKDKDGAYKWKRDSEGNLLEKDSTYKAKVKTDGSVKVKDYGADYKGKVGTDGDIKQKTTAEKRKMKKDKAKTKKKETGTK